MCSPRETRASNEKRWSAYPCRYSFEAVASTAIGFGVDMEGLATGSMVGTYDVDLTWTGWLPELTSSSDFDMDNDFDVVSMYSRDYREKFQAENTITLGTKLGIKPVLKAGAYVGISDKYNNRAWLMVSANAYLFAKLVYGFTGLPAKDPE